MTDRTRFGANSRRASLVHYGKNLYSSNSLVCIRLYAQTRCPPLRFASTWFLAGWSLQKNPPKAVCLTAATLTIMYVR